MKKITEVLITSAASLGVGVATTATTQAILRNIGVPDDTCFVVSGLSGCVAMSGTATWLSSKFSKPSEPAGEPEVFETPEETGDVATQQSPETNMAGGVKSETMNTIAVGLIRDRLDDPSMSDSEFREKIEEILGMTSNFIPDSSI